MVEDQNTSTTINIFTAVTDMSKMIPWNQHCERFVFSTQPNNTGHLT